MTPHLAFQSEVKLAQRLMLSEPYATSFKFSKFGSKPSVILVGDASQAQSASTDTADATGEADDGK